MIGASKILTVSYGTFSCTLEGFDDSFGTMKAIAEYFRDLSADDRYFGAEPATPDADMLARIAGNEINRRVEARIKDGSVTLRPSQQEAKTAVAEMPVEQVPTEVTEDRGEDRGIEDSDAAKVVADTVTDASIETAETETIAPESKPAEQPVEQPAHVTQAEADEITIPQADIFEDTPEVIQPADPESVAAKLRRIRAVVAQNKAAVASGSNFSEDQHAEEFLPDVADENDAYEDDAFETTGTSEEETTFKNENEGHAEVEEIETEAQDALEDDGNAMANIMETIKEDVSADEESIKDEYDYDFDDDVDDITDAVEDGTGDDEIDLSKFLDDNDDDLAEGEKSETNIFSDVQDTLGETALSAEEEADLVAELASVELEQDEGAVARGINTMLRSERATRVLQDENHVEDDVAVNRLMDETNAKLKTDDSTRRRSVISHLRTAVAATIADRKENPKDSVAGDDESQAYRDDLAEVVQPERADANQKQQSEPVSPLILVSEQRIDAPQSEEVKPVSQPKVAAKPEPVKIRPRRIIVSPTPVKVKADTQTETPDLKPEQSAPSEKANDALIADSTSFADFAAKMGATELPDILEAAAAYNAFIEGQPNFRRPQIMRQAASFAGKEQFNREEGLRSFGQLLRQGKIIKVERGRFEIANTTRFKPAERFAGE
jgi:hypothetical protein